MRVVIPEWIKILVNEPDAQDTPAQGSRDIVRLLAKGAQS